MKADFKKFSKSYGKKQLALYRERVKDQYEKLLTKRKIFLKNYQKFQLQLITISGGTISVFIALQGSQPVSLFIKAGFALLGLSLVSGVLSLFFYLESEQLRIQMEEEADLLSQKIDIDFIEKFGRQDVSLEKSILSSRQTFLDDFKKKLKKRQDITNEILKLLHLDGQRIEDVQIILFLLGIVFLVLGLFF